MNYQVYGLSAAAVEAETDATRFNLIGFYDGYYIPRPQRLQQSGL